MWAQALATALGVWLMAAPAVLAYGGAAENNDRIVGPLIATFACVALWQCTRDVRWVNVPLAIWLLLCPFIFDYPTQALWNSLATGVALLFLACIRGRITHDFGGGWMSLLRHENAPLADNSE